MRFVEWSKLSWSRRVAWVLLMRLPSGPWSRYLVEYVMSGKWRSQ
jgi:hypothetical protein